MTEPHRKRVRRYHEPGDIHELTFSCYRRMQLLTNNAWRVKLARAIDAACEEVGCFLAAFVFMPEHVHLLTWGFRAEAEVSSYLAHVKQPVSRQVHADLAPGNSSLQKRLMVKERPGKTCFRFWQQGGGYDRNLQTVTAVQAAIDYIHRNPVGRQLCTRNRDWRWSSAHYYESDGNELDPLLPRITPLPNDFLSTE